jgi:hypothetical protein
MGTHDGIFFCRLKASFTFAFTLAFRFTRCLQARTSEVIRNYCNDSGNIWPAMHLVKSTMSLFMSSRDREATAQISYNYVISII